MSLGNTLSRLRRQLPQIGSQNLPSAGREPGFEASAQTEEGREHGPFREGAAELARLGMCLRMPRGADVFWGFCWPVPFDRLKA